MPCNETYNVRVTTKPQDANDGVFIYTVPTSSKPATVVSSISVSNGKTLCFKEDPASTVKGLVLGVDDCGACNKPGLWKATAFPDGLSVTFSAPGGELLLKAASSAGPVYTARNNPPTIEGGRPIIRHELDWVLWVVVGLLIAIFLGYLYHKKQQRTLIVPP